MITKFVEKFMSNKLTLETAFKESPPQEYVEIVKAVVGILTDEDSFDIGYECTPDPERIHVIDDGDYQGTLLFVIGATGYQPDCYWYVKVCYGSCSGCDTLQGIIGYDNEPITEQQINDYMTLALHIVQGLKKMEG